MMKEISSNEAEAIYKSVPGGAELLAWCGCVPWFHDAEIVSLELNRKGESRLTVYGWIMLSGVDENGFGRTDKHAVVTFTMTDVSDLQLDGFNHQNVLSNLFVTRPGKDAERKPYYGPSASEDDYEISLEHCYGMDGRIRCKGLAVSFVPGRPDQLDET